MNSKSFARGNLTGDKPVRAPNVLEPQFRVVLRTELVARQRSLRALPAATATPGTCQTPTVVYDAWREPLPRVGGHVGAGNLQTPWRAQRLATSTATVLAKPTTGTVTLAVLPFPA